MTDQPEDEVETIAKVLRPMFEAWCNPDLPCADPEVDAARTVEDMIQLSARRVYAVLFE